MPSAAGAPLADDDADDRRGQAGHFEHRRGDHLGLAAFLGGNPRIGARRIDEADHRQAELGGHLHFADRLAIAFGVGAAVIAGDPLLVVAPLLMADDHHLEAIDLGPSGAHRPVVAEVLVAVELDKLLEAEFQVIVGQRPIGAAGHFDRLPGLQVGIDSLLQIGQFASQHADFILGFGRPQLAELLEAGLQLVDWAFERQSIFACHEARSSFFRYWPRALPSPRTLCRGAAAIAT